MDSDLSRRDATKSISNMLRDTPLDPITGSGGEPMKMSGGPNTSAQRDGGKGEGGLAGSRTRAALWRFVVFFAEPILSRLRDYFTITTLVDLTRSANRRAVATWHSVGALREQTETLARREDVENLAKKLRALESQSVHAHRLIEILVNRHILVFDDAVIVRTPRGYLL
ncbi:MAG: hypothetical protein JOZ60_05705, partial [Verrucomicrobia bacterium]|nr:hypothetical protein [Verrucomicrobiota bacterium]